MEYDSVRGGNEVTTSRECERPACLMDMRAAGIPSALKRVASEPGALGYKRVCFNIRELEFGRVASVIGYHWDPKMRKRLVGVQLVPQLTCENPTKGITWLLWLEGVRVLKNRWHTYGRRGLADR